MLSEITLEEGKNILMLVGIIDIIILILLYFFGKRIPKKINNIIYTVITIITVAFAVYIYSATEDFTSLGSLLILSGGYLLIKMIVKIVKKLYYNEEDSEKQNHS